MIFNEDKLQEEIIKTWGEFGVHNEVFNAMRKQISDLKQLNIPVVRERKIVRCEDPMVCLRGCSVHEQSCRHPIYERQLK